MRWLVGITDSWHECEQALGDGDGRESLACCSPWCRKESDMTEKWTITKGIRRCPRDTWESYPHNSLIWRVRLCSPQCAHWIFLLGGKDCFTQLPMIWEEHYHSQSDKRINWILVSFPTSVINSLVGFYILFRSNNARITRRTHEVVRESRATRNSHMEILAWDDTSLKNNAMYTWQKWSPSRKGLGDWRGRMQICSYVRTPEIIVFNRHTYPATWDAAPSLHWTWIYWATIKYLA